MHILKLMKKLIIIYVFMASVLLLGQNAEKQDSISIAALEFLGTGVNNLETQALFNYFKSELEHATDRQFIDQSYIDEKLNELEIKAEDCYSKACLQTVLKGLGAGQILVGTIKFSKNEYKVKIQKLDISKPKKIKSYSFRYKGNADGFITELQILAWKIMDSKAPERLLGKRTASQGAMFAKTKEILNHKKIILFTVAGLSGASFIINVERYMKSKDAANKNKKNGWETGAAAHMSSADKSINYAAYSVGLLAVALVYGDLSGILTAEDEENKNK